MTPKRALGDFGERVAALRIEALGMTVVGRQVRLPSGEIDIVAREAAETVFVEVRTRRASPGAAAESFTPVKLRRMWRCAMEYCEREGIDPDSARLDAVLIDLDAKGLVVSFEHFRGLEVPGDG